MDDYQVSYNGHTFGPGTPVNLLQIDGLRSLAPLRRQDIPRTGMDGNYPGLNLLDNRDITLTWQIADTDIEAAASELGAAFQNVPDPGSVNMTAGRYLTCHQGWGASRPDSVLQIQLPGRSVPLVAFGRPTAHKILVDSGYQYGFVTATTQFSCPDGVLYDLNTQTCQARLPDPGTMLTFPVTFPVTFGSMPVGGFTSISNPGLYPSWPVLAINGPCSIPQISLPATGQFLNLNLSLSNADQLVIDMYAGSIILNGTDVRNSTMEAGSTFWSIPPGSSQIKFQSADAVYAGAILSGALLPAYSGV